MMSIHYVMTNDLFCMQIIALIMYGLLIVLYSSFFTVAALRNVKHFFMIIAEKIIVKRGAVNINVVASDTGINITHANDEIVITLPNIPTETSMIL